MIQPRVDQLTIVFTWKRNCHPRVKISRVLDRTIANKRGELRVHGIRILTVFFVGVYPQSSCRA